MAAFDMNELNINSVVDDIYNNECKDFLTTHKNEIVVDTAETQGTTFSITNIDEEHPENLTIKDANGNETLFSACEQGLAKQTEELEKEAIQEDLSKTVPSITEEQNAKTNEDVQSDLDKLRNAPIQNNTIPNEVVQAVEKNLTNNGYNLNNGTARDVAAVQDTINNSTVLSNSSEEEILQDAVDIVEKTNDSYGVDTEVKIIQCDEHLDMILDEYASGNVSNAEYKFTQYLFKRVTTTPREINIKDGIIYIDGIRPQLSSDLILNSNDLGNFSRYLCNGQYGELINWKAVYNYFGDALISITIDTQDYFPNRVIATLPILEQEAATKGINYARTYMYSLFPTLVTFKIGAKTYSKYDDEVIKRNSGKNVFTGETAYDRDLRKQAFKDGVGITLHGASANVSKWAMKNVANYACNRGNRGILRFTGGLIARVGIFGIFGAINLAVQALHAGFTPIDQLEKESKTEDSHFGDFSGFAEEKPAEDTKKK